MEVSISTYSFLDVACTIVGPGGAFPIGTGSENADEGITIEFVEDLNTMTGGADGSIMHSLHAGRKGLITINLLKVSPTNELLSALYNFQRLSSANHGQNTILLTDFARGDVYTNRLCAFKRFPTNAYGKDAGFLAWRFDCGFVDPILATSTT